MEFLQLVKQKSKYSLLFLFIIVIGISEFLYAYINNTPELISFYLRLSKHNPYFLEKAVDSQLRKNKEIYPEFKYDFNDSKFSSDVIEMYKKDEFKYIDRELPFLVYNLALSADRLGEHELSIDLLRRSILLDPDLSFTYVELANLFYINGRQDDAISTINKCTVRFYPKKHCTDYLENILSKETFMKPGFLYETISSYYSGLRG